MGGMAPTHKHTPHDPQARLPFLRSLISAKRANARTSPAGFCRTRAYRHVLELWRSPAAHIAPLFLQYTTDKQTIIHPRPHYTFTRRNFPQNGNVHLCLNRALLRHVINARHNCVSFLFCLQIFSRTRERTALSATTNSNLRAHGLGIALPRRRGSRAIL